MVNRIRPFLGPAPPPKSPRRYAVIETHETFVLVPIAEGRRVGSLLARLWPPRWVVTTDVFGVTHRLRTGTILRTFTSSPESRSARRAWEKAIDAECEEEDPYGQ